MLKNDGFERLDLSVEPRSITLLLYLISLLFFFEPLLLLLLLLLFFGVGCSIFIGIGRLGDGLEWLDTSSADGDDTLFEFSWTGRSGNRTGILFSGSVGRSNACCAFGNRPAHNPGNGACGLFGKRRCQSGYGPKPCGNNGAEPGNTINGLCRDAIGNCGIFDPRNDWFERVTGVGGDDNELERCEFTGCGSLQYCLCLDNDAAVPKLCVHFSHRICTRQSACIRLWRHKFENCV